MTYKITCSETVVYEIFTEANNEEQAKEDLMSGNIEVTDDDIKDSNGFQVDFIEEVSEVKAK